jgi:hypothetical protein
MHCHRNVGAICALLLFLTFPQRAVAQPDTQLWSEITLTWIKDWRNLYYSTDKPDSSTARIRNRVELLYPMTRPRITDNGATYLIGDAEWFWPVDEPDERFASKQRVRGGIGYRHSFGWRFEALYIWDRARDSAEEGFTSSDQAFDVKVRRVW